MTDNRQVRARDRDREDIAEVLRAAFAAGCLDRAELEDRSDKAYSALTAGQLAELVDDLPAQLADEDPAVPGRQAGWVPGALLAIGGAGLVIAATTRAPIAAIPLILLWLVLLVREGWALWPGHSAQDRRRDRGR